MASCLQWTSSVQDGQTIHVCLDDDVTFPWDFTLGQGEVITYLEWFFTGQRQEIVAFSSHNTFVPLSAYSGRVERLTNGGLNLHHVTAADTGNYSVEINGHDASGASFSLFRTALVSVTSKCCCQLSVSVCLSVCVSVSVSLSLSLTLCYTTPQWGAADAEISPIW